MPTTTVNVISRTSTTTLNNNSAVQAILGKVQDAAQGQAYMNSYYYAPDPANLNLKTMINRLTMSYNSVQTS